MRYPDDGLDQDDQDLELDEASDGPAPLRSVSGRTWPEAGVYVTDRCVLGDECCCPHVDHGPDECFSAEMAAGFYIE